MACACKQKERGGGQWREKGGGVEGEGLEREVRREVRTECAAGCEQEGGHGGEDGGTVGMCLHAEGGGEVEERREWGVSRDERRECEDQGV